MPTPGGFLHWHWNAENVTLDIFLVQRELLPPPLEPERTNIQPIKKKQEKVKKML
jgi:hypothetical protein